jgi:hypothetical protein
VCADSDELVEEKIKQCALICATLTNCRFWSWGIEGAKLKCWFRTGNKGLTSVPAEAEGYITGSRKCYSEVDYAKGPTHPPTAEVVTFKGTSCPVSTDGGEGLHAKEFVRLGTMSSGKAVYFSRLTEKWLYWDEKCEDRPSWIVSATPPGRVGDEPSAAPNCNVMARNYNEGSFSGPTSGLWSVDCGRNDGAPNFMRMAMLVDKSGLVAEFWKGEADRKESGAPGREADIKRIDPRVDYWHTLHLWDDLPADMRNGFFAKWSGYLKVREADDYQFQLGSSDPTKLMWYHAKSNTWAIFEHNPQGEFEYSNIEDLTPETLRYLEPGYHRFKILFQAQSDGKTGLVFKYKGHDTQYAWKVVPTNALTVEMPGCASVDANGHVMCEEGPVIPSGGKCTISGCAAGATPSSVTCETSGLISALGAFQCNSSPQTAIPTASPTNEPVQATPEPTPASTEFVAPPNPNMPEMEDLPSIIPAGL